MSTAVVCPDVEVLRRFLAGEIAISDGDQVENHIAGCANCQKIIESIESNDPVLTSLGRRSRVLSDYGVRNLADRLVPQLKNLWPGVPSQPSSPPEPPGSVISPTDTAETGRQPAATVTDPTNPPFTKSAKVLGEIGPYRLLRELGKGGMGVVYLAEDPRLGRAVALKVIHDQRFLQPQYRTRFEREGAALARFSHPNIVQIYEVGQHEDKPFLSIEYVAGGTLAEYLGGRPQPTRDSAQCVATLARAVQYAHERGIVHRDLKPSNVLMEEAESGGRRVESQKATGSQTSALGPPPLPALRPKITDFGLAKHLDEHGLTQSFDLLGTPGYMAPELAAGAGASAASVAADVYSLGAILYEMFTGRPPFRGETVLDTLDQVRSANPVAPRRLRPTLPRELDTICLKCLEKNAARRYGSAAALADDLDRYLGGEPIHARPAASWERLAKWARRKPAVAILLAVSAVFTISAVVGVLVHNAQLRQAAVEARRQQERAETQYREARDTLRQMLARASARGGEGIPKLEELRREQQEDALAFFLKMAEQHGDDPDVRFDAAQALHQAALLQNGLGRLEEATQNLRRAEAHFAALAAEFPDQPMYRLHHADTLKVLGGTGFLPPADAEDCLRRALAISAELVRAQPASVPIGLADAHIRMTLGTLLFNKRDWAGAEDHFRRAAALYEELSREQPETASYRSVLAKAYVNLSVLLQNTDRSPHEFHDKAEATLERLYGENPDDDEVVTTLAMLRVNWASVQEAEGKADAAISDLTKNVAMLEQALLREPNNAALRDRLYRTFGVQGNILGNLGRFAESAEFWRRTVALSPSPQQADFHRLFLAMSLAKAGQHTLAVSEIEDWNTRSTPGTPAEQILHCAYVYCSSIEAMRSVGQLSVQSRDETVARYAAQAVDFLRRAKQSYGSERWKLTAPGLLVDERFKPLRNHADFQRLMAADD